MICQITLVLLSFEVEARAFLVRVGARARDYMAITMSEAEKPQIEKFRDAARALECDDDDQTFKDRLAFVAKQKPKADKPDA